ncbi:MAG: hypothetical protein IJE43_19690 [Alphaproteobacteria bacterium]|nr:hypothetical protein [Alphaproteobacteria bacterium]
MKTRGYRYPECLKAECLQLFLSKTMSREELIKEYGLGKTTLWNWVRDYCKENNLVFSEYYNNLVEKQSRRYVSYKYIWNFCASHPTMKNTEVARILNIDNATVTRVKKKFGGQVNELKEVD